MIYFIWYSTYTQLDQWSISRFRRKSSWLLPIT